MWNIYIIIPFLLASFAAVAYIFSRSVLRSTKRVAKTGAGRFVPSLPPNVKVPRGHDLRPAFLRLFTPLQLPRPPSPMGLPLLGHALAFNVANPQKTLLELAVRHGPVVGLNFGIVKGPPLVRTRHMSDRIHTDGQILRSAFQVLLSDPKAVTSLLAGDNVHVFKGPGYGAILSGSPHNTVGQASPPQTAGVASSIAHAYC